MSDWTWLDAAIVGVPSATIAVVVGAVTLLIVLGIVAIRVRRRGRSTGGISLDSPAEILEEMRKRLEDLPTLPQFATNHGEELPLLDPSAEPTPAPLPSRKSAPPLPTNAEDPITGEPDEEAYRTWLREWLVYAEQYGDDAPNDPVIQ